MVCIESKKLGSSYPCFIIAEAGVNHNGDVSLAKRLIDEASNSGADAVKFQIFNAGNIVTINAEKAGYQKKSESQSSTQYEMLKKLELTNKEFRILSDYAKEKGLVFLATPFDVESIDFLDEIGVSAFKISSGEINNNTLLKYVAHKQKPIILSTGMSTLCDVENALRVIEGEGNLDIILLHCVSDYPAEVKDVNLRAMDTLRHAFGYLVGYSDHSIGITIPIAAVSLGACIIEKHFTLDKNLPGPDHKASLEPDELKMMIKGIREIEIAMGTGIKKPSQSEIENKKAIRRSIVAAKDIPEHTIITSELVTTKRPGTGISAENLPMVIGTRTRRHIKKDEILAWTDVIDTNHAGE